MIIVRSHGTHPPDFAVKGPFKMLVATVLSQNTNVKNARLALENLERDRALTPENIAKVPLSRLRSRIRASGLYKSKARAIKATALHVMREYGGNMRRMLSKDPPLLRQELTSLVGIGPKTADIILAFCAGVPTVPIDTHISRVCVRLGLVDQGAGYELTKRKLEEVIPKRNRLSGHLALINFGRNVCVAQRPRCSTCLVRQHCRYYREVLGRKG